MGRSARIISSSGIYHVVLRGVNRQNIFEDTMDRKKMMKVLQQYTEEMGVEFYAWCFMNNHVHFLFKADDIKNFMKKVECSYVAYFNRKYNRSGHLFQDRFKSEAVEDDRYFVSVVRYIHQNPYKAGICRPEDFGWSSYEEYVNVPKLCNTSVFYDIIEEGSFKQLMDELNANVHIDYYDRITDDMAFKIAEDCMAPDSVFAIQRFNREIRKLKIRDMYSRGVGISQISRITGIPETTVRRACQ